MLPPTSDGAGVPPGDTPKVSSFFQSTPQIPANSARPITHWTHELADEALKRGIVASISHDSVGRFLKNLHRGTPRTCRRRNSNGRAKVLGSAAGVS